MATFTISVPKELKEMIDAHPEINWSEYLKRKFVERVKELKKFKELKNSGRLK